MDILIKTREYSIRKKITSDMKVDERISFSEMA